MGNGTTIDLKGDNKSLNDAIEESLKLTQEFATEATREFKSVGEASEDLVSKLGIVVSNLDELIESNKELVPAQAEIIANLRDQASSTMSLVSEVKEQAVVTAGVTAASKGYIAVAGESVAATKTATAAVAENTLALSKNVAMLGAGLMTTAKFNLAILAAELSYEGFRLAAENTGKSLEVLDNRLESTKRLLNESGGDIEKIRARLNELGMTADEVGIKVVTNWTKISDSTGKLMSQAFQGGVDKVGDETIKGFEKFFNTLKKNTDNDITAMADGWAKWLDSTRESIKYAQDYWTKYYLQQQGFSDELIKQVMDNAARQEKIAKDNKVNQINRAMNAEALKEHADYQAKRRDQLITTEKIEKLVTNASLANLTRTLETYKQQREQLALTGQFHGRIADEWIAKDGAVFAAQQQLLEKQKEIRRELAEAVSANAGADREDAAEYEREAAAYAVMGHKQILQLIEDEEDAIRELHQTDFKNIAEYDRAKEVSIKRLESLRAAAIRAEGQMQRDEDAKTLAAADKRERDRLAREQRYITWRMNEIAIAGSKQLAILEDQGASLQKLHEAKMSQIDAEYQAERRYLIDINASENELLKLGSDLYDRKKREQTNFELQRRRDLDQRDALLIETRKQKEDELFDKARKSEKERSEYRIKRLKEEADISLKMVNTEVEKTRIRLQLEEAIKKEKEGIAKLQKDGVDINEKTGGKAPKNQKEYNAELRTYNAARKKEMQEAKKKRDSDRAIAKAAKKASALSAPGEGIEAERVRKEARDKANAAKAKKHAEYQQKQKAASLQTQIRQMAQNRELGVGPKDMGLRIMDMIRKDGQSPTSQMSDAQDKAARQKTAEAADKTRTHTYNSWRSLTNIERLLEKVGTLK